MSYQFTAGRFKGWASDNTPLAGGRLYTYSSGTTTHKAAYTDATLGAACTYVSDGVGGLYIALDSKGEAQLWLGSGAYTFKLTDSSGSTVWTVDGVQDPAESAKPYTDALRSDMASTSEVSKGSALVGYNKALAYASGIGKYLYDCITYKLGVEASRYSDGRSFGVGDFSDGLAVNIHGGDDGTTTRVISLRAQTAPLFIGYTNRTNSESGGPVGRSVVSFEGYRLANDSDSRESGAVRVITEGVSSNRLGARTAILTRRDGFTDADFVERWWVQNDGNIYHGGGTGGVGNANRSGYAYGNTVYTISGQTGRAAIEQTTNAADADQTIIGDQSWLANFQTDEKRIALIQGVLAGTTATKRGGELRYYLKPDNAALSEAFRFTAYGLRTVGPIGTLQKAPTLTITSNAITPTAYVSIVGAGLIKNITVPAHFASAGGEIKIIPSAAFTTDTTGNIALASTAVVNRVLTFVYDGNAALWYPSY